MLALPTRTAQNASTPAGRVRALGLVSAIALGATLLFSGCATSPSGPDDTQSTEAVTLPDTVGARADLAQDQLRALGFIVTLDAGDESVWAPSNWVVERQEPVTGEAAPGTAVTLYLGRPPAEVWDGISDGTWKGGDYAIGDTVTPGTALLTDTLSWDYEFTVTGAPMLTTKDGGETVTITSPLTVTRIQEAWPDRDFDDVISFIFEPGVPPESARMNEAWGTNTKLSCDRDSLALDESTACTVSFTTVPEAIENSYWRVERTYDVAAWPGQVP